MQRRTDGNVKNFIAENVCTSPVLESQDYDLKTTESAENFHKSMYDLFEKHGVINDLRAYLRGHIVQVLRSARTGDPPACQKNFTQRLELPFQALNMLFAEYLLRYEYSYTLSVFVSEIPLANMVFAFAKSLMQGATNAELRFKDEDVWSILNYLGIKCESQHAADVVKMYKSDKQLPLLLCMLKCMPLYQEPVGVDKDSSNSLSSSMNSLSTISHQSPNHITLLHNKCKHSAYCKACKTKILKIREKYKKKKKNFAQNFKKASLKPQTVDFLIKNIDTMERSLIDEMFQQLKSVYETELEMARKSEETRLKKALAKHAVQLQQKRDELEESYKTRELELECSIKQKKRFLWGLARLLREQHAQMARAMRDIRDETTRLTAKEDSLKSQLADAEQVLKQKAEDMRRQISDELAVLENHLRCMKEERDRISMERSELEQIKHQCETDNNTRIEDPRPHYESLKNEFQTIQKYLQTIKLAPKSVESGTITELAGVSSRIDVVLNNGQDVERSSSENIVKAKVVNNLKKFKNANVSQSNLDEINVGSRSVSSVAGGRELKEHESLRRLAEENERLRTFATQQREHIEELSSQQARLQAELTAARVSRGAAAAVRPRTAPAVAVDGGLFAQVHSWSGANASQGWRKGAGEELGGLTSARPRISLPGGAVPFVGVVGERRSDNRRYLINQWRSLRRVYPTAVTETSDAPKTTDFNDEPDVAGPSFRLPSANVSEENLNNNENLKPAEELQHQITCEQRLEAPDSTEVPKKSSKSALKEAKGRRKTKANKPKQPPSREPSPTNVLKEAKLRLRKLEIEAEAVEMSYINFRRKQAMRSEKRRAKNDSKIVEMDLNQFRPSVSFETHKNNTPHENQPKTDYSKCIEEYYTKYDIGETHFKNKNTTSVKVKPIPSLTANEAASYKSDIKENYLETPIIEFRKYYHSEKQVNEDLAEELKTVDKNCEKAKNPKSSAFSSLSHDRSQIPTVTIQHSESKSPSRTLSPNSDNISVKSSPKSKTTKNGDIPESKTKDLLPTAPGKLDIKYRSESPKAQDNAASDNVNGNETETELQQQGKEKKLEILKQNKTKHENSISIKNSYADDVGNPTLNIEIEKSISINNSSSNDIEDTKLKIEVENTASDFEGIELMKDKNSLLIEIENVSQVNDVKITESQTQDLLLFVSSHSKESGPNPDFQKDTQTAQMTIIVSPEKNTTEQPSNSFITQSLGHDLEEKSEEQSRQFPKSVYETDEMLDLTKEDWLQKSNMSANGDPDYPDDFSIEADNISQHTDSNRSPISMPSNSENDDFWN